MQVTRHELYQLTMKFTINSWIRDLMSLKSLGRAVTVAWPIGYRPRLAFASRRHGCLFR